MIPSWMRTCPIQLSLLRDSTFLAQIAWDERTGRNTNIVNFDGVITDDP